MITAGTTGSPSASTNNNKESLYAPKTGVFKGIVAAINPSPAQIDQLLGKELNWTVEYTGTSTEGEPKINMDIWLQDLASKEYYRLKFLLVDKARESKNNPGTFQWVNTAGQLIYAKNEADIKQLTGPMYEQFRSRDHRIALVGEENLFEFLTTWVLQGQRPTDEVIINPVLSRMFKGDFSELQELVGAQAARQDQGALLALATVSEKEGGKSYQNTWKKVLPGWLYDKFLAGDRSGMIGRWVTEIEGKYGPKDRYSLGALNAPATPTQTAYGPVKNGRTSEIPGAKEYQERSNDSLPF